MWMTAAATSRRPRAAGAPAGVRLVPAFDQYVVAATRHAEPLMPGRLPRPRSTGRRAGSRRCCSSPADGRRLAPRAQGPPPVESRSSRSSGAAKARALAGAEAEAERIAAFLGGELELSWADRERDLLMARRQAVRVLLVDEAGTRAALPRRPPRDRPRVLVPAGRRAGGRTKRRAPSGPSRARGVARRRQVSRGRAAVARRALFTWRRGPEPRPRRGRKRRLRRGRRSMPGGRAAGTIVAVAALGRGPARAPMDVPVGRSTVSTPGAEPGCGGRGGPAGPAPTAGTRARRRAPATAARMRMPSPTRRRRRLRSGWSFGAPVRGAAADACRAPAGCRSAGRRRRARGRH